MTENKFKVGDKVRINPTAEVVWTDWKLAQKDGTTGTITEITDDGYRVTWDRDSYPRKSSLLSDAELLPLTPAPEIIVGGHMYRLVNSIAGQVWRDAEGDIMIVTDEKDDDGDRRVLYINRQHRGVLGFYEPSASFVAHSLREALESGKIKVEDL